MKKDFFGDIRCLVYIINIAIQIILKDFLSNSDIEEYLNFYTEDQFLNNNINNPRKEINSLIPKSKFLFNIFFLKK